MTKRDTSWSNTFAGFGRIVKSPAFFIAVGVVGGLWFVFDSGMVL